MIKMDRMTAIVAVIVVILSIVAPVTVVVTATTPGTTAVVNPITFEKVNFYVYFTVSSADNLLPNEDEPMVGGGSTLTDIMTSAFGSSTEYTLELLPTGAVRSVNGVIPDEGKTWVIFQWQPPSGWVYTAPNPTADAFIAENTSYLIAMTGSHTVSGTTVYDVPEIDGPISEALFFIKCDASKYGIKAEQLGEGARGTELLSMLSDGFWMKGSGSSVSDAFIDACRTTFEWDPPESGEGSVILRVPASRCGSLSGDQCIGLEIGSGEGSTIAGWLGIFLGLRDVSVNAFSYLYWNQYSWSDSDYKWGFNGYCLGYYDPAVTKYTAMIYYLSSEGGSGNPFWDIDPYDAQPVNATV